jgi:hypothetical protein
VAPQVILDARIYSWRGDVLLVLDADGLRCSFPVEWTDRAPVDPFMMVAAGRCPFRTEDLVELAAGQPPGTGRIPGAHQGGKAKGRRGPVLTADVRRYGPLVDLAAARHPVVDIKVAEAGGHQFIGQQEEHVVLHVQHPGGGQLPAERERDVAEPGGDLLLEKQAVLPCDHPVAGSRQTRRQHHAAPAPEPAVHP